MLWRLSEVSEGVLVCVDQHGVWLKGDGIDLSSVDELNRRKPKGRLGRLLPTLIPQLLDLGIAYADGKDIFFKFTDFAQLEDSEIDAFENVAPWCPFAVEIETMGSLGREDFKYAVRFYWGREQVHVERLGCFVKKAEIVYRLENRTFSLLSAIDEFNASPGWEKEKKDVYLSFSKIKGLAQEVGAEIDEHIAAQRVIVPAKINVDLIPEPNGRISFVPKIDQVPDEGLFRAYFASGEVEDIYSVVDEDGVRVRVILDEDQKEVLRRMRKVRHLGGADKASVLRNPYEVFDGVSDSVEVDLDQFGPRVKGIGDFPFISQPFIRYSETGIFDDVKDISHGESKKLEAGIDCSYIDGTQERVTFDSTKDLIGVYNDARSAWENGQRTIDFKGRTIVVDKQFVDGLKSVVDLVTKQKKEHKPKEGQHAYLLIFTNEDKLEYQEEEEIKLIPEESFSLPDALVDSTQLKTYQREGLRWLQLNYLLYQNGGRRGCLLADEMGLGKTFQVLAFLSWLIERGAISLQSDLSDEPRYNPILIVAPVMLLENESWQKDMKKFFKYEGDIFQPYTVLHGKNLRSLRKSRAPGRETEIKESVLDLDRLRQYRVILTSYETVVNYQYSFASMKDSWSVVVTDEAQEYKTANTKISHALKSLAPHVRVACTGTPVETKLSDVWNIFDFLQPGLLGSATEFAKEYERPLLDDPQCQDEILTRLKDKLHFSKPYAYLLRREKHGTLDGLPPKHDHKVYCQLSLVQRERHIDFLNQVRSREAGSHPLAVLQQLMKLYQHPDLLPTYQGLLPGQEEQAIERSPKLKAVLDILKQIRARREKVLIFTRSLHMQQMLASLISHQFGIIVDIINGMVARSGSPRSGTRTRSEGIRRFCESEGFNVLIVSPDVAGVGLTIVEANHVIHYGRWWNPAKELQATDRVYRIGQTKDVHVYYPISQDPHGELKTFDERLDNLLERRRELAREFLAPMPSDTENGSELIDDLIGGEEIGGGANEKFTPLSEQEISLLTWDRFEALVALVEKKAGRQAIITPKSSDFGVDIVSIADGTIHLIQCKHTLWQSKCDSDTIAETINAFDNYRLHWLRGLQRVLLKPSLVTNGKFTRSALSLAKERDVEAIDCNRFLALTNEHPCTFAEVELMEGTRSKNMKEVERKVKSVFDARRND